MKIPEAVYYSLPKAPFLQPEEVIRELDLKPGEKVIDFGAGSGFWAIPMAEAVGPSGQVYVTDAKAENLSVIKNKANRQGLMNLSYFEAPYDGSIMPLQTKVDLFLCSNIVSLVSSPDQIIERAKKLAKNGTRLIVIDWNERSKIGPNQDDRLKVEDFILRAGKAGFEFKKLLSAGAHHTGLYFLYSK